MSRRNSGQFFSDLGELITVVSCLFFFSIVVSCKQEVAEVKKEYDRMVGYATYDPALDDSYFNPCTPEAGQYYYYPPGLAYDGEMSKVKSEMKRMYESPGIKGQTGFYTVRFYVNCIGATGFFRVESLNEELKDFTFDERISDQLLEASKKLDGWRVGVDSKGNEGEYYQYLTYHIVDSELIDIAP